MHFNAHALLTICQFQRVITKYQAKHIIQYKNQLVNVWNQ